MSVLPVRQLVLSLALVAALAGVLATVQLAPSGFAAATTLHVESARVGATNAYARTAFRSSNGARADRDRAVLRGDACLKRAALRQARAMRAEGRIFHQDPGRIQADCAVGWVGENVAYGYPTGRALVREGWMRSEGHRANILSRSYRLMGLAAVKDDGGRWYAAQVFGRR